MRGRTAAVTGSTGGIGRAVAEALAGAGANIVLNGFGDAAEIEEQRAGLEARFGIGAAWHGADMARPADIRDLLETAAARFGAVDILVNNAGIQHTDPVEDFPEDRWDAVIAVNLSAPFHATKAAIGPMKARGWGRIVNIASVHGLVASVHKAAYIAAKHGLVGLTKTVALEAAGTGVTCNAVCPGWVRTPLVEAQIEARAAREGVAVEAAAAELLREKQPSGRFTAVGEVGAAVAFLCGEAAANMTGATLTLDGGWSAQ